MFSLLYCVYGYRNYQFTNNDRYFGACYFSNYLLDGEMNIQTKPYVPTLSEPEIVKEMIRRISYLMRERDEQPGKEMWIAWGESDEGMELETLQRMLEQSDYWDGKYE